MTEDRRRGLDLPGVGPTISTTSGPRPASTRALKSIKAKTLILAGTGDLLNPEYEAMQAAQYIADARFLSINDQRPLGHLSGAGATPPENELQNAAMAGFLEIVTDRGRKIQ